MPAEKDSENFLKEIIGFCVSSCLMRCRRRRHHIYFSCDIHDDIKPIILHPPHQIFFLFFLLKGLYFGGKLGRRSFYLIVFQSKYAFPTLFCVYLLKIVIILFVALHSLNCQKHFLTSDSNFQIKDIFFNLV